MRAALPQRGRSVLTGKLGWRLTATPTTPHGGGEVWHVSETVFQRLAFGQRAEGVVAVAEMPRPTLARLNWGESSASWAGSLTATPTESTACKQAVAHEVERCRLIAVLEGVEKPGNVGAVLRSADAAGVSAVIVADGRTDLYNPNAIRASLGTIFTVPVCEASSGEALAWLRERQFQILAARVDGSVGYTQVDYRRPTAIVLGGEAPGLSPVWKGSDITAVRLPMLGTADSLNVSVTAAVLFYEALGSETLQRDPEWGRHSCLPWADKSGSPPPSTPYSVLSFENWIELIMGNTP